MAGNARQEMGSSKVSGNDKNNWKKEEFLRNSSFFAIKRVDY